ncbi:hypothetical protein NM208_g15229 [Fusarium decemcellulare]|uniref:Uncharacterized protein n=1 Tax=Fusarium decemcellulare TaxID=57161 RepID=A0ACC1RDL2_9HYPO|nr:hypothetical protein NM208_g15229 [Fusarium decemcellulare]
MQDMAAIIQTNLCDTDQDAQPTPTAAMAAREEILLLVEEPEVRRHVSDGSILTGPPLVIVEAMIGPYFEMVNPYMPLWTKEGFRRLMGSAAESTNAADKRAYHVCANNLVLLTLQAKSLHSRATSGNPCTDAPMASSIDGDLVRSFITNAKRALENVELLLLNPSLLSLQALLSLCLVAQTSLSENVTALLFSFAVHSAKSIGLHHWNSPDPSEESTAEESQERRNVMYCMVSLSRSVAWSSGLSFSLSGVSVLEHELAASSEDRTTAHLAARISLLRLEEQIYTGLYSDEATRQGAEAVGKTALARGRKLDEWATEHAEDLDEDQYCGSLLDGLRHELAIRFYSLQTLVTWPIPDESTASRPMLDSCRSSLRLFRRLWLATSERGHYLDLALLVASYPPVPFFELARHVICKQPASDDDLELLQSFSSIIRIFSEWSEENAYMKRLSRFTEIVIRLTNASRDDGLSTQAEMWSGPAGQAYMQTLDPFPGSVVANTQTYAGDSAASSSSRSNTTPLSGIAQPLRPAPEMDPIPVPAASASTISPPLAPFDGGFVNRLSPVYDLDGWLVEPRPPTSLPPNSMNSFMFQDNNGFSFDRLDLG